MSTTKLLLKARPTIAQLRDRLQPPPSDGLELYLDARDLAGDDWLARIRAQIAAVDLPNGFVAVVEGPVNAFDRPYFDLTANSAATHQLIDRLVECGAVLGAVAANVHLVAPRATASDFDEAVKAATLDAARPVLRYYVECCKRAGLVPLIENMPPVLRMRQGAYVYSAIGVEPWEFVTIVDDLPDLGVTVDLSHAQLYVNALRIAPPFQAELADLLAFLRRRAVDLTLPDYIGCLGTRVVNVHVSNARGILGEGLPYHDGDAPLDRIVFDLLDQARFVVTETLEDDPERAIHMREAQAAIRRLQALRSRDDSPAVESVVAPVNPTRLPEDAG